MEFLRAENQQVVTESGKALLLRGFGLGGWLLQEGYMWKLYTKCDRPRRMETLIEKLCGEKFSAQFWIRYFESYITERDLEFISRQGMNCVRLPINARHLPQCLPQVDALIDWCRKRNLYVILDMHAAPGGQTGTNIDDSESDTPLLFLEPEFQNELVSLWVSLAQRYANEPAVAGYDLLNEPLPNWFSQYNERVMPLYCRLISAIRKVDSRHLLILEGVHWATDWSIFENLETDLTDKNLMLQFHKYWNSPDAESLTRYTDIRARLNLPIFMGEGGENNCDWYTGMFPMLEEQNISWSFWTYKKMDCVNSPVSFPKPQGWDDLVCYIDGEGLLEQEQAFSIFEDFLNQIENYCFVNESVCRALNREAPLVIPAEYFSSCYILTERESGAMLRMNSPATILFRNCENREPDYKRYGGEPQPESESLCVRLCTKEWMEYLFRTSRRAEWEILLDCFAKNLDSVLSVSIDGNTVVLTKEDAGFRTRFYCSPGTHTLRISCELGEALLYEIHIISVKECRADPTGKQED